MPRPLAALAIIFAIVIGVAAVLLYRADRQRVLEMTNRDAAPTADAPAAATEAPAPEARPPQPPPETAQATPPPSKEPVDATEGIKPAVPEVAHGETLTPEQAAAPELSAPAGETEAAEAAASQPTPQPPSAESPEVAATDTPGPTLTPQSGPTEEQAAAARPETNANTPPSGEGAPATSAEQQAAVTAPGEQASAPNRRQIAEGSAPGEVPTQPGIATTETPAVSIGPTERETAAAAQAVTPTPEGTTPSAEGAEGTTAPLPEATTTEEQAASVAPLSAQPPTTAEAGPPVPPGQQAAATDTPTVPIVPEAAPTQEQAATAGEAPTEPGGTPAAAEEKVAAIQPEAPVSATAPTASESAPAPADEQAATEAPAAPSEEQMAEGKATSPSVETPVPPSSSSPAPAVAAEGPASPTKPATKSDSEQQIAAVERTSPSVETPVPTSPEAKPASPTVEIPASQAEATAPVAATMPVTDGAPTNALNTESATSEQPQVAIEPPASVPAEELLQSIEITGVEASSSPADALTAEASVDAMDLAGLTVAAAAPQSDELPVTGEAAPGIPDARDATINAAAAGQPEELAVSGEAAPGIPDARDVTIKAAELEDKMLYVAGDAPPGTLVRVYADEELVGEARTDVNGAWLLEAAKDVPVGEVVFRVEAAPETDVATAPTVEASAPFMRYADGVVLEPVGTAEISDDALALSEAGASPMLSYVIIRRGDNLWRIARRNYGRGIKYHAIYTANQDQIRNPHRIYPGQVFVIPTRDRSWETATQ